VATSDSVVAIYLKEIEPVIVEPDCDDVAPDTVKVTPDGAALAERLKENSNRTIDVTKDFFTRKLSHK
jgi:hypothetical protein